MATRNLVYFVSSRPLRFRSPVPADDLENGARHAAMDKYFRGRSADAPPGAPSLLRALLMTDLYNVSASGCDVDLASTELYPANRHGLLLH